MKLFKLLELTKKPYNSLILYSLLDRIPIIVIGNDSNKVDDFLIELSEVINFRKELVFYTDFISDSEYESLIENESIDYNSQRIFIRCPCGVSIKALNKFRDFSSWLIGLELENDNTKIKQVKVSIRKKIKKILIICLFPNKKSVELEGINVKSLDLSLEQYILQKISQDTERSVNKMKRVLHERIKMKELDKDLIETLLDFKEETKELKTNILKKEIQNFYAGSKRSFFIFSRLNLLSNINFNINIGSKTLFETIDYHDAPIGRILSFISKEWGENFTSIVENGKRVNALDSMQSLWG